MENIKDAATLYLLFLLCTTLLWLNTEVSLDIINALVYEFLYQWCCMQSACMCVRSLKEADADILAVDQAVILVAFTVMFAADSCYFHKISGASRTIAHIFLSNTSFHPALSNCASVDGQTVELCMLSVESY